MAEEKKPASPESGEIPKIRTFKTDAEIFMKEKKISQLDIARGAYSAGGGTLRAAPAERFNYKIIIFAGIAILIMGLAGFFAFRLFFPAAPTPQNGAEKPIANFLPVDGTKEIIFSESNPGALISALLEERKKNLRFDTAVYLPVKILKNTGEEKFLAASDLARSFGWQAPLEFLDNLQPDFNLLAVYGQNSQDIAVILKIKNFPSALASLFDWERTIWQDFKPFLQAEDVKNISQFAFADDLIKNNDARVLKNSPPAGGGKIILGYVIFNKQYVIISTSSEALSTILGRLIALPPR